ncbi:ShlB/FhaC/HecB family hemolysin secretion/activation protein [uncultured Marinobacter sp.]|uniref:ShlB/FhaC/HecB family hemolysin secretion/activation protein n=1 Tax=uncultured Marinobacter sp. TaxID=187379 RepID=UPI0030D8B4FD
MEIREQQDKLQREKLQRELDNDFQQLAPPSPKPPEPETVGPCFGIISITFQGLQDLPDDLINEIELKARPFLDQCLALAQLSDLIEQLNRLFLERGLVTTRAFLPEQSLNGGELKIRIVVGEVQGYESDSLTPRNIHWAFPLDAGDVLNLRDIEQGLDQINRLRSNNATIDMLPGDKPGQTIVNVKNNQNFWLGARMSLEGDSIEQGDDYRGRLDVFADDLLGINDALIINGNQSLAEKSHSQSYGYGVDYSFPWRYNLFTLSGNQFNYENIVQGTNRTFVVSGDSQVIDASANRTLYRGQSTKLDGLVGLASKTTNNYIEDARIDVSSRQLSIGRVELRIKQFIGQDMTAFASLAAEHGLRVLGADDDRQGGFPDDAQFRKYRFYGALTKPLWRWNVGLTGQYQYSPDRLSASEQVLVASSSLITGFSDYSLAGDSGGWLKLDIGSPYVALRFIPGFHTNLAFSLLKGWVPHRSDSQPQHGSASAAQIAFTVVGQGLSLNLQVGKRLEAPSYNQIKADVPDVGLTLSYSI